MISQIALEMLNVYFINVFLTKTEILKLKLPRLFIPYDDESDFALCFVLAP